MLSFLKKHWIFLASLIAAVILIIFRYNQGVIQQDEYISYASYLPFSVKDISFYDSRLFPGLPILIYFLNFIFLNKILAGYIVTLISFIGSYVLLYKMTRSKLSVLPLVFPPIMLNLLTLVDTEFPFIFLTLLALYLLKNKKVNLAFLVLGVSIWFRLAGLAVLMGILFYYLFKKKVAVFAWAIPYFLLPVLLFLLYNNHFYGPNNLFYQLLTYEALHPARINIGIIQLGQDLIRSFRWHWYRIFLSGLFYLVFYAYIWARSIKKKTLEFWIMTAFYLFILSVNLVPFLENLGRYLAPTVPIFWLTIHDKPKKLLLPLGLLAVSFVVVLV